MESIDQIVDRVFPQHVDHQPSLADLAEWKASIKTALPEAIVDLVLVDDDGVRLDVRAPAAGGWVHARRTCEVRS